MILMSVLDSLSIELNNLRAVSMGDSFPPLPSLPLIVGTFIINNVAYANHSSLGLGLQEVSK